MEKMKTLTLLLGVLLLPTSALADRVFPENLLKKWGYKTAKVEKKHSTRDSGFLSLLLEVLKRHRKRRRN